LRLQAGRKLKMARLLAGGGFIEEEREALLQSATWLARALAIENRMQEPAELSESLRAPASMFWGPSAALLAEYAAVASSPAAPSADAIQGLLGGLPA
jgi:hypothetical protein